jgi:hypothetical protein
VTGFASKEVDMIPRESQSTLAPGQEWADVKTTARILGVSASFLNKERLSGDGPPYGKFSSAVRYHIPTLKAWAASRMQRSTCENPEAR